MNNCRFGRWTVVREIGLKKGHAVWLAICDCGTIKNVWRYLLINGHSKSCGCLARELSSSRARKQIKHGHLKNGERSRTYNAWKNMHSRCRNKNRHDYKNYGGRGISICSRWYKFMNFLHDMGEAPCGLSLDRINNGKGYSKQNCRWSTPKMQAMNRRSRWRDRDNDVA